MMPSPNQRNPSELTMESGALELSEEKKIPSGTPTPDRLSNASTPGSPVSDDTCPICLGHIQDKCVADSCLHSFCLVCLKEWAKQKAVCPLCKLTFTKIMHDIKSETEYKEWKVPRPDPVAERSAGIANFQEYLDAERRRFFGYRTTNFPGAATLRHFNPGRMVIPDALPSGPRERRPTRYNLRGSSMFRLSVYLNNVWVQPIADITGRYRQTSPELYREQPALTHRLVPWVNRELTALLPSSRIGFVLAEIMELIERHAINSREFKRAIQQHLGRRTNHFIHEFYHFARSPYDMIGHDNASHYLHRDGFDDNESTNSSSSDDSDAIVEVDSTGNPITSSSNRDSSQGPSASGNVIREETLTQEGSVVISSDEMSSTDIEGTSALTPSSLGDSPSVHNPQPPRLGANNVRSLIGRARQFLSSVNEGASTSRIEESTSSNSQNLSSHLKKETVDSDDSDACIILDEVPPRKERTPELINIDSDDDEASTTKKESHWKKKLSEEFSYSSHNHKAGRSEKKGKKKPRLKRDNFSARQYDIAGPSTSRSAEQDHSYCTEDGYDNCEPSGSKSKSRNLSSSKSSRNTSKKQDIGHSSRSRNHIHLSNVTLIYSDDDENLVKSHTYKEKYTDKYKEKHRQKRSYSEKTNKYHSRSRSPSREKSRHVRKDHRSKVKNSSRSAAETSDWHSTMHDIHRISNSSSVVDSWEPSDYTWSPTSSSTARGSSQHDYSWDSAPSRDSSHDSRDSCYREWKSDKTTSKSKKSARKNKKSKHKNKHEKLKKSRRNKKKKRVKSKKSYNYSSSSDSETDNVKSRNPSRSKRRRERDYSSTESESVELVQRKKARRLSSSETSSGTDT